MDLSHSSLNFSVEILDQLKAIHSCIHSRINDLYGFPSSQEPFTKDVARPGLIKPKVVPPQESDLDSVDVIAARNRQDGTIQRNNQSSKFGDGSVAIASSTTDKEPATEDCNVVNISGAPTEFRAIDDNAMTSNDYLKARFVARPSYDASTAASSDLIVPVSQPIHKRLCSKYDRSEIFEKVWKMPLCRAAEELGVRDRTLSNACVRLYIPTPPPGYWGMHEHNRESVTRPELPELPDSLISHSIRSPEPIGPPTVSPQLMSRYDRTRLYEDVWTKPLAHLTVEYGVSSATLATRCKRLHIPRPEINYWQRKAKNLPVPGRPPLGAVVVVRSKCNPQPELASDKATTKYSASSSGSVTERDENESQTTDVDLIFQTAIPIPKHLLTKYDRKDIYEKMWQMPLRQVAKTLGMKEQSLSSACIRLFIPTPPRGYWCRREETRKSVPRPPLPDLPDSVVSQAKPVQRPSGPPTVSALLMSRYDREKLYDDVWTKPLIHLAREYGIHHTALGQRCKNLHIPIPGVDYWQRKAKNQPVPERPPLTPIIVTGFTSNECDWDERKKRYKGRHDSQERRKRENRHLK